MFCNHPIFIGSYPQGLVQFDTVANARACVNYFGLAQVVMLYNNPYGPPIRRMSLNATVLMSIIRNVSSVGNFDDGTVILTVCCCYPVDVPGIVERVGYPSSDWTDRVATLSH